MESANNNNMLNLPKTYCKKCTSWHSDSVSGCVHAGSPSFSSTNWAPGELPKNRASKRLPGASPLAWHSLISIHYLCHRRTQCTPWGVCEEEIKGEQWLREKGKALNSAEDFLFAISFADSPPQDCATFTRKQQDCDSLLAHPSGFWYHLSSRPAGKEEAWAFIFALSDSFRLDSIH